MAPNSPHRELLALCAAESSPPDRLPEGLFEAAAAHRVGALVLARLFETGMISELPAEQRAFLERRRRELRRRAALAEVESERIREQLDAADLTFAMLKGLELGTAAYDASWHREFRDLDVLVAPADLKASVRALQSLGYRFIHDWRALRAYRRHHFHYQLQHPMGFIVEIHWDVVRPGAYYRLDAESILVRSQGGRPSAEDHLLLLVLQNLSEGFAQLARIVDVDRLIRKSERFDWGLLARTARDGRLSKPLALTLQLARRLLGTRVPHGFVPSLGVRRLSRHQLACFQPGRHLLERRSAERTSAANLLRLWLLPSLGTRARFVRALLTRRQLDPLVWVWRLDSPDLLAERDLVHRLEVFAKLVAYQALLNGRGLIDRRERDFWDDQLPGPAANAPAETTWSPIAISSSAPARSTTSAIEPNE